VTGGALERRGVDLEHDVTLSARRRGSVGDGVPRQATLAPFGRPLVAAGHVLGLARATSTNKSCVLASHDDRLARAAANVT
jgi:hypothetical protein